MELADDLKCLLTEFSAISVASRELVEENTKLKKRTDEKEKQLMESVALTCRLEKDLQRKQNMLDMIHHQLSVIPELKQEVEELRVSVTRLEEMSVSKDQEQSRLQQKHLGDLNHLKEEIERERIDSREEEKKRMEEMEEFFRQAHETELASVEKRGEREKQVLVDQLRKFEDELRKVKAEHEEELEMMRVQIVSAKSKANQAVPNNSEIYRKKMSAMQEHYERQIQELLTKNLQNQFNEGTVDATNATTPENMRKKKKVTFAVAESPNQDDDDVDDPSVASKPKPNTTEKKYENIFAVAANRFSRAKLPSSRVGDVEEGNEARKCLDTPNFDPMGDDGLCESKGGMLKEKTPSRFKFKFNNINSSMFGAATEFGKFSTTVGRGYDARDQGRGYDARDQGLDDSFAGVCEGGQTGSATGGLKRKLFSEAAGPQLLD